MLNMTVPNITKIAYKGGGAKGFIDIGVGLEFDRLGISKQVDTVAGTSVGAIFSLFFASGKPAVELQKLAFDTDFYKLINNHWEIVNLWDLCTKGGLHDGKDLHNYIKAFIKSITGDENTSFSQWHSLKELHPELHLKDIFVEACNISRQINQVFSYEDEITKDVPIWKAIAASSAFPGYFEAIEINGELYSDGGLQNNCPLDLFDILPGIPNPQAIGIWLASTNEIRFIANGILPPPQKLSTPIDIFKAQVESQLESDTFKLFDSIYKGKMILCDNCGIGTLDFQMTEIQKEMLVLSGIISVFIYFSSQYPEFAAEHYSLEVFESIGLTEERLASAGFKPSSYENLIARLRKLPTPIPSVLDATSVLITPLKALTLSTPTTQIQMAAQTEPVHDPVPQSISPSRQCVLF